MPLVNSQRLDQDFENKPRPTAADHHQVLLTRARSLDSGDQLLLELAFEKNLTMRQLGKIFRRPAGSISRRVNRLCARLRDPLVAALIEPGCVLSPRYRKIAIQYFAQQRRIDSLASEHQIKPSEVRGILHFVRGWYRGIHIDARAAGRV